MAQTNEEILAQLKKLLIAPSNKVSRASQRYTHVGGTWGRVYESFRHFINNYDITSSLTLFASPAIATGGEVTDAGSGRVSVSAGTGRARQTNSASGTMTDISWDAKTLTLAADTLHYIYIDYNSGNPTPTAYTSDQNDYTKVLVALVYRDGSAVHITNVNTPTANVDRAVMRHLYYVQGAEKGDGGTISETGTRNITGTACKIYIALNEYEHPSFDTSSGNTFTYLYADGTGGWTEVTGSTQIDNTQYDDGSGILATLSNNKYGVHWVYLGTDGDNYVQYGSGDYTLAEAQAATLPLNRPSNLDKWHGIYAAKIIIKKSAATFHSIIQTDEDSGIGQSVATDHGSLTGLTDDDHTQYLLVDGTRAMTGDLDMGGNDVNNATTFNATSVTVGYTNSYTGYINLIREIGAGFGMVTGYYNNQKIRLNSSVDDAAYIDLHGGTEASYGGEIHLISANGTVIGSANASADGQLTVVGSGTTNATNALRVENASGELLMQIDDDGNNVKIGHLAGNAVTGEYENVFIGWGAGKLVDTYSSVVIGRMAMGNTSATVAQNFQNVAIGEGTLYECQSAENTAVGHAALRLLTTGGKNVGIGHDAGAYANGVTPMYTNANSVFIGFGAAANANGNTNEIAIGYNAYGNGSNTATIGDSTLVGFYLGGGTMFASASTASLASLNIPTGTTPSSPNTGDIWASGDNLFYENSVGTTLLNSPIVEKIAVTDETTAIASTGTAQATFRVTETMTVTEVRASLTTACTTGTFTIDINKTGVGSILGTKLTIDATEKTSTTAATPATIITALLSEDDEITIDFDNIGDGTATGLKIQLIGY